MVCQRVVGDHVLAFIQSNSFYHMQQVRIQLQPPVTIETAGSVKGLWYKSHLTHDPSLRSRHAGPHQHESLSRLNGTEGDPDHSAVFALNSAGDQEEWSRLVAAIRLRSTLIR